MGGEDSQRQESAGGELVLLVQAANRYRHKQILCGCSLLIDRVACPIIDNNSSIIVHLLVCEISPKIHLGIVVRVRQKGPREYIPFCRVLSPRTFLPAAWMFDACVCVQIQCSFAPLPRRRCGIRPFCPSHSAVGAISTYASLPQAFAATSDSCSPCPVTLVEHWQSLCNRRGSLPIKRGKGNAKWGQHSCQGLVKTNYERKMSSKLGRDLRAAQHTQPA